MLIRRIKKRIPPGEKLKKAKEIHISQVVSTKV